MRCNLPALTRKRADWLLEHVFNEPEGEDITPKDFCLYKVVRAMQFFNLERRRDDCDDLYSVFSDPYFLEGNSEGTTYWLAMALAIKELYGLDEQALRKVVMG